MRAFFFGAKTCRVADSVRRAAHSRLDLLKEVAGTKVYEQRRSESVKLMSETGCVIVLLLVFDF